MKTILKWLGFHIHDWMKWRISEPWQITAYNDIGVKTVMEKGYIQERVCQTCGLKVAKSTTIWS